LFIADTRLTLGHGDLPDPERLLPTKYVQDRQPALEDPAVLGPVPGDDHEGVVKQPGRDGQDRRCVLTTLPRSRPPQAAAKG
jgi:hypothetical protein